MQMNLWPVNPDHHPHLCQLYVTPKFSASLHPVDLEDLVAVVVDDLTAMRAREGRETGS